MKHQPATRFLFLLLGWLWFGFWPLVVNRAELVQAQQPSSPAAETIRSAAPSPAAPPIEINQLAINQPAVAKPPPPQPKPVQAGAAKAGPVKPADARRETTLVRSVVMDFEQRRRDDLPSEPVGPISLVVLGVARDRGTTAENRRTRSYEIEVEHVIYGRWEPGRLICQSGQPVEPGERQIFSLVSSWHESKITPDPLAAWNLKAIAPAADEFAQRALAQVRWDWHVLTAHAVVVGQITAAPSPSTEAGTVESKRREQLPRLKVERWVAGEQMKEDQEWLVEFDELPRKGVDTPLAGRSWLLFISEAEAPREDQPGIWHIDYWQPAALADAAEEAWRRRDRFPVTRQLIQGRRTGVRDIYWQGPLEQAIQLLDSPTETANLLGRQRLLTEPQAAQPLVARQIARYLARTLPTAVSAPTTKPEADQGPEDKSGARKHEEDQEPADREQAEPTERAILLRRQLNLIRTLGYLEGHRADGDLAKLFADQLAIVRRESATQVTAAPTAKEPLQGNHSLLWLYRAMDETEAARRFGRALLELQATVSPAWKQELAELIDKGRVEEQVDLAAARMTLAGVRPIQSQKSLWHDGQYKLAFSQNGEYLATVGNDVARVWKTADWSKSAEWELSGAVQAVLFADADRQLIVAGERAEEGFLERWNWKTGTRLQVVDDAIRAVDSLALSRDERMLVSSSDAEAQLRWWSWPEGKLLRTISLEEEGSNPALHPDGQWLLREVHALAWKQERLDGTPARSPALAVRSLVFAPDGSRIYAAERPVRGREPAGEATDNPIEVTGEPFIIRAHEATGEFAVRPEQSRLVAGHQLTISAQGNRLVVAAPRETNCLFTVLELPSLRLIARCQLPGTMDTGRVESVALAPRGNILAVALDDEPPVLFNTQTGQRFLPTAGHAGRIVELSFDDSGSVLTTVDEEGWECDWDPTTLASPRRTRRAPEGKPVGVRGASEGVLSEDGRQLYQLQLDPRGRQIEVQVVEVATGLRRRVGAAAAPWLPSGPRGLVPGGTFLHVGTQIYDRQTLRLISAKHLRGMEIESLTFSREGRCYVAVSTDRQVADFVGPAVSTAPLGWITMHETKTGRTLLALPVQDSPVQRVALAPDARRLAVVLADNSLQVWNVPEQN
jgi:WD40 repeat protein